MNAINPEEFSRSSRPGLTRVELVPDDVLWEIVTRDGACMQLDVDPEWTGDARTDRELAARICAHCPVRWECLELELRTSGEYTLGVWAGLPAEVVRALYPEWRSRRQRRVGHVDNHPGDQPDGHASEQDGGQR